MLWLMAHMMIMSHDDDDDDDHMINHSRLFLLGSIYHSRLFLLGSARHARPQHMRPGGRIAA